MQNGNTLLQNATQGETTALPARKVFDQRTVDAVQYFFARIKMIYGAGKFSSQWPTDADLKMAKREWADDIAKLTKDEIDAVMYNAKTNIYEADWAWPNIGLMLSGAKNNNPAHQLFLPEPPRNILPPDQAVKRAAQLRAML